jgi:cyclophilin family peptidyl-prolyl cis-trans isomerase
MCDGSASSGESPENDVGPISDYTARVKRTAVSLFIACAALTLAAACGSGSSPDVNPKVPPGAKSSGGHHAVIETDKGSIEITFLERDAPNAVENFRLLAEHGYYDGLTFHRIVKGFMVQGGDPEGTGNGGQSAWGKPFVDEIDRETPLYKAGYKRGLVAMANSGPNTNGSQFFIMHQDYPLPPKYVIFAQVTNGLDVVDALATVPTKPDGGENSSPVTPPVIKKVTIKP